MSRKQILWIYNQVKEYLHGVPDPDEYVEPLGKLWEKIKEKSTNKDEADQALRMLITFRNILDAASKEGVEL